MAKQILKGIKGGDFSEGTSRQKAAMKEIDLTTLVAEIGCPTLIIHGQEDNIVDSKAADYLVQSIANAELKMVANAGHLLLAECPKQLYQLSSDFFSNYTGPV